MTKKIRDYLDYIFYRSYCFYSKYNDHDPKFMSVLIVTIIEVIIMVLVFTVINHFLEIGRSNKQELKFLKIFAGAFCLFLIFVNYRIFFKKNIVEFKNKWDSEEITSRKKKGWVIVFLFFIPLVAIIVYSYLRNNLGIL